VQVGEVTAWDLVTSYLKACAQRAANTGDDENKPVQRNPVTTTTKLK